MNTAAQVNELSIDGMLDGSTHIRIGVNGLTQLGRLLANTAPVSFELGSLGEFRTMENAWFFMRGGMQNERLKMARGKELATLKVREPLRECHPLPSIDHLSKGIELSLTSMTPFRYSILAALYAKITQNQQLKDLLILSNENPSIPFVRYNYETDEYGRELVLIHEQPWFVEGLLAIRRLLVQA